MARNKGSANLAASLEVLAGAPLDARETVPTKADLTASGNFPYFYIGMETYVVADNKKYRLVGDDPTDLENWEEVGSGGGGGGAEIDDTATASDKVWSSQKIDTTKLNKVLVEAVKIAGGDVTDIASAITSLAGIARVLTLTKNGFGPSASYNYNSENYGTKGAVKAYHYLWEAGNSFNYPTGVPQWFTYPSYDVNYLFINYRNEEDTFIDEFAYCFYTESSTAKMRMYQRRCTKSGSTWTFPDWSRVDDAITAGTGLTKSGSTMSIKQFASGDMDDVIDELPEGNTLVGIAQAFNKGDIYSTSEKMIGQWTDGKPLYQKTFNVGSLATTGEHAVNHGISNLGTIVDVQGIVTNGSGTGLPLLYCGFNSGPTLARYIYAVVNSTQVKVQNSEAYSGYNAYVTVQYTKTTDSAVSIGEDTEYSTSEKIVGTWIDGSKIYQKTVQVTLPTVSSAGTDASQDYDIGFSSTWNALELKSVVFSSSGAKFFLPDIRMYSGTTLVYVNVQFLASRKLRIRCSNPDFSGATAYVTVQYTKA